MSTPSTVRAEQPTRPAAGVDCRVYERYSCSLPSACSPTAARELKEARWPAVIHDLSQGGMRLILRRRYEPGSCLTIELPGKDGQDPYTVLVHVVHARKDESGGWSLGCKLLGSLSEEELRRLAVIESETEAEPGPSDADPPRGPSQSLRQRSRKRIIAGVQFRLDSPAGTLLEGVIRHMALPVNWQGLPGKVLTLYAFREEGPLPAIRLRVLRCGPQDGRWVFHGELPHAPSEELLRALQGQAKQSNG